MKWILLTAALVAGVGSIVWRCGRANKDAGSPRPETGGPGAAQTSRRRRGRSQTIGKVVVDAYSTEWARRFDTSSVEVARGVLEGANPDLVRRIDEAVGVVDLQFTNPRQDASEITATVAVNYTGTGSRSSAQIDLTWEDLPHDVRAEFTRSGLGSTVVRTWRATSTQ